MRSYLGPTVFYGYLKAGLFAVPTRDHTVYLRSEGLDDDFVVAEIETVRLFERWRDSPYGGHKHLAYGAPQTWREDRKFNEAEEGYAKGWRNPVPVPHVECAISERGESYIEVMDVTRTIWLAANAASFIPVACHPDQIDILIRLTDAPEDGWKHSSTMRLDAGACLPGVPQ